MEPANALQMLIQDLHVTVKHFEPVKIIFKRIANLASVYLTNLYDFPLGCTYQGDINIKILISFFHCLLAFNCSTDGDCHGHGTCNTTVSVGKKSIM